MYKLILILIIIVTTAQLVRGQSETPVLDSTDIYDAAITRLERYDGKSLWGYINGGADIFLEYGFQKVTVQEIVWNKYNFKIEVFKMNDEEAAFGIYSVSRRKCVAADSISKFMCITPYRIQIVHGRLYISIVNDNGSKEEQELGLQIAKIILHKSKEKTFTLPTLFDKDVFLPYVTRLRCFRGRLGIENGFPDWEKLFTGFAEYLIYLLPVESKDGTLYVAQIEFSDESQMRRFVNKIEADKKFCKIVGDSSSLKIIYNESNIEHDKLEQYKQALGE